jgi:hypothetical protein
VLAPATGLACNFSLLRFVCLHACVAFHFEELGGMLGEPTDLVGMGVIYIYIDIINIYICIYIKIININPLHGDCIPWLCGNIDRDYKYKTIIT